MGSRELLSQLRVRVGDTRHTVPAFTIASRDTMATDVEVSTSNGWLRTEIENGSSEAQALSISLTDASYNTLEKLVNYISSTFGRQYEVTPADGMIKDHASIDLETITYNGIERQQVTLRTHRWSDDDLLRFVESGARRHNPSYSLETLPLGEHDMVLAFAHVELLRALATDASRRQGLSGSVQDYLSLATSIEASVVADAKRLAKALLPLRTDDDALRDGDVIIGTFSRESLRSGFQSPSPANIRPQAPMLYTPDSADVFDFSVVVRWRRTSEQDVLRLELWRDTTPEVRRTRNNTTFPSSARCVWSSANRGQKVQEGVNTEDLAGELIAAYHDGFVIPSAVTPFGEPPDALLPSTPYWWRLYIFDRNGEYSASDAVQATTKTERAMFSRDPLIPALSVVSGPRSGGVTVTVKGTAINTVSKVLVGGVEATFTGVSATELSFVTPAVHRFAAPLQDVVLISTNELRDVYPQAWRYTS